MPERFFKPEFLHISAKKYIPDYEKNQDVFPLLEGRNKAIKNSSKKCPIYRCLQQGKSSTDIHILIDLLLKESFRFLSITYSHSYFLEFSVGNKQFFM